MGISGVQQAASLDVLKQTLRIQQNMAQSMINSMQQNNQAVQKDGDGDHGVEPGKGQHVNFRA